MALRVNECLEELHERLAQALGEAGLLVEADAKVNCPVQTGNLRASITTQLDDGALECLVGTNVEYAAYVEMGTSKQQAKPYLKPALEQNRDRIVRHFEGLI